MIFCRSWFVTDWIHRNSLERRQFTMSITFDPYLTIYQTYWSFEENVLMFWTCIIKWCPLVSEESNGIFGTFITVFRECKLIATLTNNHNKKKSVEWWTFPTKNSSFSEQLSIKFMWISKITTAN